MKSLAKNSVYNIIYQSLSLIFPLITSMYVSRIIFEDGVGKVAYAQNIASYFVALAALGFPAYGIREIAKVRTDVKNKNQVFSELFIINAISTTFAGVAYILLVAFIDSFRGELFLYLSAGLIVVLNYANIDWLYQGQEDYGYITLRSLIVKILSLLLLFVFVKQKEDYTNYALISSVGTACNYFFNIFHARKFIQFQWHGLEIKKHLRPLIILAIASFLGNIYNKIDVTMLGVMVDDASVGYYSNAHKIILMAITCCTAVSTVFMPRLSYYYEHNREALNKLVSFGTQILLFIALPATIGLAALAQDITVLLFGRTFLPAGITLCIFAPMLIIRPVGDLLCYQLLISIGQEKKRLYSNLLASGANVLLNALLIPRWQQNGAAIASVVSEIVANGILLYYILRVVHVEISVNFMLKNLLACALMGLLVLLVMHTFGSGILKVFVSTIAGAAFYVVMQYFLKNEIIEYFLQRIKQKYHRP